MLFVMRVSLLYIIYLSFYGRHAPHWIFKGGGAHAPVPLYNPAACYVKPSFSSMSVNITAVFHHFYKSNIFQLLSHHQTLYIWFKVPHIWITMETFLQSYWALVYYSYFYHMLIFCCMYKYTIPLQFEFPVNFIKQ